LGHWGGRTKWVAVVVLFSAWIVLVASAAEAGAGKRHMVFIASHGHSGTRYLKDVLNELERITCYHERAPSAVRLSEARIKGMETSYGVRREKVEAILRDLEAEPFRDPGQAYCDTTHQFILTWPDVITDYFHEEQRTITTSL